MKLKQVYKLTDACIMNILLKIHLQVSNNSLVDWLQLTSACNGNQQCSHIYNGAVIDSCRENYIADYMEIFYDCLLCMVLL